MGGRGSSGGAAKTASVRFEQRPGGGSFGGKVVALDTKTGKQVGELEWGGNNDVWGISVDKTHRRQGVATKMWDEAARINGRPLDHSENRTNLGDKFARKIGGHLPPRSDTYH